MRMFLALLLLPTIVKAELLTLIEDSATNGLASSVSIASVDGSTDFDQHSVNHNVTDLTATSMAQVAQGGSLAFNFSLSKMNKLGSSSTQRKITASADIYNLCDVKQTASTASAIGFGTARGNGSYLHSGVVASDEIWLIGSFVFKLDFDHLAGLGVPDITGSMTTVCGPNTITCTYDRFNRRWRAKGKITRYDGVAVETDTWILGDEMNHTVTFTTYIDQTGLPVAARTIPASTDVNVSLFSEASNEPSIGVSNTTEGIKASAVVSFKVNDRNPVD